jgi:hypothetical protein
MQLNTYESGHHPDLFVTVPTAEARSVISTVDALSTLDLRVVREDYAMPEDRRDTRFRELVSTGIAKDGYAVHAFEQAVVRAPSRPGAKP